jgi:hypothetical protein
MTSKEFGCSTCYGKDPEKAAENLRNFKEIADLVDESHFTLQILSCPGCSQQYVFIWNETIDWNGGDDAQYTSVLPITNDEANELVAQGKDVKINRIEQFGQSRRYLVIDRPNSIKKFVLWANGPLFIDRYSH